ncbi:hypothetical protein CS063_00195 [Sporanaerobium hydrogeniformans]|uniref:Uncharacterized protein n=1 Tax=Sporanaerobium hydrogeniformans TaxID=3072179 RepID=A0AC61DGH2_9FIRM|nr:zinc-ribbon domain-containing protein [Sporanaerobium hydrogeniformans]PHV71933.1 hypothetical protein CS063_00195 [Sporanaerobium hydrogeniformans]
MSKKYYCPTCNKEVEMIAACGASNYFCKHCKRLVSSKKVIKKEEKELKKE